MTREEIREEAEGIVRTACNLQRNASLQAANDAVEAKVAALARATLEEAARAVCLLCRDHYDVGRDSMGSWVHEPYMGREPQYSACLASEIHDLIAALEVKGE